MYNGTKSHPDLAPFKNKGFILPASGGQKAALSSQPALRIASVGENFLHKGCTPFLEWPISNAWLSPGV